jgi:ectoine hydroxylase-related dioxygenase (phytanoyl-CoA dioxygenase family)
MATATAPAPVLSPQQLADYQRDGFAIARGLFRRDEVDAIRTAFQDLAEAGAVPGLFEPAGGADPLARYPRIMHPHRRTDLACGRLARRHLLDPRILDALAALTGDEQLGVQSMYYFKPPQARGQALHQDNHYLQVHPGTCMAAWTAIDHVDAGNGGMQVVPGSHRLPVLPVRPSDPNLSFVDHQVDIPDGGRPVPTELAPGDVLFFNGSLIHGSTPNSSHDRWRRSLICHYAPAGTRAMSAWYRPQLRRDGGELVLPQPVDDRARGE